MEKTKKKISKNLLKNIKNVIKFFLLTFFLINSHVSSKEILIEKIYVNKDNKIYFKYNDLEQNYFLEIYKKNKKIIRNSSNIFYDIRMDVLGNYIAGVFNGNTKKTNILINNKIFKDDCLNKNFHIFEQTFIWFSQCNEKYFLNFKSKNNPIKKIEIKYPIIKFIEEDNKLYFLANNFNNHLFYNIAIEDFDLKITNNKKFFYKIDYKKEIENLFFRYFKENLSLINNDTGRLSWFLSYQLLAVSELINIKDFSYLEKDIITKSNKILFNLINQYKKNKWKVKKYNSNYKAERFLVTDSTIVYSMISLCNNLKDNCKFKHLIDNILEDIFSYYENFYDMDYNHYRFNNIVNKNEFLPYNMQNIFALALLEQLKVSDNKKYLKKVEQLFDSFFENIYINKTHWDYWPIYSKNHSKIKKKGEDIRHASWNVNFLLKYCTHYYFSDRYKCSYIKKKLNNIFKNLHVNNGFKQHLSSSEKVNLKYPEWFWLHLDIIKNPFFNRFLHDNFFYYDGGYFLNNVLLYKKII